VLHVSSCVRCASIKPKRIEQRNLGRSRKRLLVMRRDQLKIAPFAVDLTSGSGYKLGASGTRTAAHVTYYGFMATLSTRWHGRTALVTGGGGFLGSNLCHALASRGARVRVVDSFLREGGANPDNLRGIDIELVRGDIGTIDLHPVLTGVDVVFNLAARTSHMGGQHDPLSDIATNAVAQLRLIQAVREASPDAVVVHASTRQIYGPPRRLPVAEDHPVVPPDANSISLLAGEHYWMLEHRLRGARVVSLRLTNCYGPRMRIRDGEQTFLGLWIGRALARQPFEVWGGSQLRDLAFVDDVSEAFLAAATTAACEGRIFNVGGAGPASLREIADLVVRASGDDARYAICEFPADRSRIDIGSYHADDAAFRAATGWSPAVNIPDGLRRTIDWFRPLRSQYL
jgi:UDP-glucose 4-epimerase